MRQVWGFWFCVGFAVTGVIILMIFYSTAPEKTKKLQVEVVKEAVQKKNYCAYMEGKPEDYNTYDMCHPI